MILNAHLAHQIHNGRTTLLILPAARRPQPGKTVTIRRPATTSEYDQLLTQEQIRQVHDRRRKPPTVMVCRIHTTDTLYPVLLHELDLRQVHAAGFKRREDLHAFWESEYGREPATTTTCATVTFEVDRTDTPRLIVAATTGRGDYTTSPHLAMALEPEALSVEDHRRHVQERAGMTAEQYAALERANFDREVEALTLGRRLDRAIQQARLEGRQVSREVRVIEQRLRALENRRAA